MVILPVVKLKPERTKLLQEIHICGPLVFGIGIPSVPLQIPGCINMYVGQGEAKGSELVVYV
jgi:hypothetical protein